MTQPRVEIDGRAPTTAQLTTAALSHYGHFTAMQVRAGRVRGLGLHLTRLDAANREMFGTSLDGDLVRDHIRHALGPEPVDASVRVSVLAPFGGATRPVLVTVRPPAEIAAGPRSLQSVPYQRSLAHLKHVGDFGQTYYIDRAARNGFDDALLTGSGGVISEGGVTNIAFFDGTTVVWPEAPALAGITMQLLEPRLDAVGLPSRRAQVRLADLRSYTAAFVTNAQGIAPVGRVDARAIPVDTVLMKRVNQVYEGIAWDAI
ncbi:MAG TPA: aminotransferase class IV [Rugosimonospora sp.]|nr:aminotransferase class IV [Rugosimonospora sp.]